MEENVKNVFLITHKYRKPYHMQNLKARYKNKILFTDSLENADIVLCIDQEDKNISELLQAEEMAIPIAYFTEELLPERIIDEELKDRKSPPFLEIDFPDVDL